MFNTERSTFQQSSVEDSAQFWPHFKLKRYLSFLLSLGFLTVYAFYFGPGGGSGVWSDRAITPTNFALVFEGTLLGLATFFLWRGIRRMLGS